MWQQLDLSPALSIRAEEIHISLSRRSGSSVETTLLPGLLPCAHLTRIALAFEFCGVDDLDKGLEALVPLVDVALRSFWGDKIAKLAPILGKVGFLRGLEDREGYVRLVAGALERFCPEEQEEVEGRVWRVVLENLRDGEALEGLDSRVHRAEAPDYGGSSDGFLLGGAEYDSGDECLFGDDYDDDYDREILWDDWDDGPEFPGLLMDNLSDGGDELWESLDNDGGTRGDTKVDSYIWDENELLLDSE